MERPVPRTRQIVAAVIGNALEWYDFTVYGFLAAIMSRLFFPASNEYISLLVYLATFGVGFFMRPVGAIVLGLYADRHGRKAAMQLVMLMIGLPLCFLVVGVPILIGTWVWALSTGIRAMQESSQPDPGQS